MKKIIAIFLSLALFFALVACGEGKTNEAASGSDNSNATDVTDTTNLLLPASAEIYDGEELVGKYTYEWSDSGCVFNFTEGEPLSGGAVSAKYDGTKLEFYNAEGNSVGMYYSFDSEGYLTLEGFDGGNTEYVLTYGETRDDFTFKDIKKSEELIFYAHNYPSENYLTVDSIGAGIILQQKFIYTEYGDITTKMSVDTTTGEYVVSGSKYEYQYDSFGNMLSMKRTSDVRVVTAKYTLSDKPMTEGWQSAVTDIAISETYGLDSVYYLVAPMIR